MLKRITFCILATILIMSSAMSAFAEGLYGTPIIEIATQDHTYTEKVVNSPTNLLSYAGVEDITLKWDAVPNATGYKVYRTYGSNTIEFNTQDNKYVDTDVLPNITFRYVVKAIYQNGSLSEPSNQAPAQLLDCSGNGLFGTYYSDSEAEDLALTRIDPVIDFKWNGNSSPISLVRSKNVVGDEFTICWTGYIKPVISGSYDFSVSSKKAEANLIIDGKIIIEAGNKKSDSRMVLQAGRFYAVKLEYIASTGADWVTLMWLKPDSKNKSQIIPSSNLFPKISNTLAAPKNLEATVTNKSVTLTWNKVIGADKYKLYRICDGVEVAVGEISQNLASYVDNSVSWGASYTYYLVAINNGIEGIRSNQAIAKISPSTPTRLKANAEFTTIKLSWNASVGAQSYIVLRRRATEGTYSEIATIEGTVTNYTDNSVNTTNKAGDKCYYKVVAVSNGLRSNFSNTASATLYPYFNTDMGDFKYYIINNGYNLKSNFILGSYVPVTMELKLSDTTVNPKFILDEALLNEDNIKGLFLSSFVNIKGGKNISVKINGSTCDANGIDYIATIEKPSNQNPYIKVKGNYQKGDIIKVEFMVKISASTKAIDNGIMQYYNKPYAIFLEIGADKKGTTNNPIAIMDKLKQLFILNIHIQKPNKIR